MNQYTVLLLGSGGREHAIAWRLARSASLTRLVCAPGNPGMVRLAELREVDVNDGAAVVKLAKDVAADLVVIGPEAPLAAGVADDLRRAGFATFGPSQAAARLEWDKAFAKEFMERHDIPTAASRTFTSNDLEAARAYLREQSLPVVLKANGLAAGKGVVIAATLDEAIAAFVEMTAGAAFGEAGATVVIEEYMEGEEASIFAISDGTAYVLLAPSQDHKRVGDGDTGPNTGGMGAYAPAPVVTSEVLERVRTEIIEPTLRGMAVEGAPYVGCLYVGVMIDDGRPRVVEFNSRFGDPEAQVVLPLVEGDFAHMLYAAATGTLAELGDVRSGGTAVCVVMAARGYPGAYRKGMYVHGIGEALGLAGITVFHAGTALEGEHLVTAGGRVLGVTAVAAGDDLDGTIARAYEAVEMIHFDATPGEDIADMVRLAVERQLDPGALYRRDIGHKGIARNARTV